MNKQIKKGAIISYISILINLLLALIYTPWMVSKIGKANYGLVTLSSSLISVFLMDFGIGSSVSRFLSKYLAEDRENEINDFLGVVFKLFFGIALLIFLVLFILYFFLDDIYKGLTNEELNTFKTLFIIVSSYSVISFAFIPLDGILNAYERFAAVKLIGMIQKISSVIIIILAIILGFGVEAVVASYGISGMIAIFLKVAILLKKKTVFPNLLHKSKAITKEIFSFSIWITIISVCQRCVFNLAPTILGIVSNSAEIAIFSPANTLESYFFLFAAAINGLFLPEVSRLISTNNKIGIETLMVKVGKFQLIFLGLIFSGFLLLGKEFMILWMGPDYKLSYIGALFIFLPDLFVFTQQIGNTYLVASNKVKYQAFGYIIMAITCVISSFVLSKIYGGVGACIAIAIGYSINFIYINFIFAKVAMLDMKKFYFSCYFRCLPAILTTIFVGLLIKIFVNITSWLMLLVSAIVIAFLYLSITLLISLNKVEKKEIIFKIKSKIKTQKY